MFKRIMLCAGFIAVILLAGCPTGDSSSPTVTVDNQSSYDISMLWAVPDAAALESMQQADQLAANLITVPIKAGEQKESTISDEAKDLVAVAITGTGTYSWSELGFTLTNDAYTWVLTDDNARLETGQ